MTDNCQNNNSV